MTLVAGLRAAAYGVPFQPVGGVHGSDLAALNGWRKIPDPYGSGKEVYVIPAISPDVAVIHANEVDEYGNARVLGSPFWDHPLTLAAQPELTLVPGFMVEAAAVVPRGAWPGSMHPLYEVDYPAVESYLKDEPGILEAHLAAAPEQKRDG